MPQFGMKTLLLAFAVGALWLSTSSGYTAAPDVQASIALVILLGAGFAAVCFRGRRRMFWAGFFIAFLLMSCTPLGRMYPHLVPSFSWAPAGIEYALRAKSQGAQAAFVEATFYQTARIVWVLALSALVGFTAAYIYDQSRRSDTE